MRAVGVHDPRGNRPPRARAGARARWVVCLDRGRLLAPPFGEAKGGRNMLPAGATQLATHATEAIENEQPQDSGSRPRSNQGAQCALPNTPAETYRQAACGRCPRSARQPPSAVKCAGLCAAGRLLGKPAPALSRGGRLLAEAPHAMRVPVAPLRPKPSRSNNGSMQNGQGKAQGAHRAPPSISAETYRQDACGRCPRSARQPPAAGKCAGLCAAGRLLGSWAPHLMRGKGGRTCLSDGATLLAPHRLKPIEIEQHSIPPPLAHHPRHVLRGA